jgi:thiol-disulfide isomerase/thioredoxin
VSSVSTLVLALQVFLAAVFATAGGTKLLDRAGSRAALLDFGVPAGVAPAASLALPLAELATAILLLVRPLGRVGAAAALLLLLAFIAAISRQLAQGRAPDCHCFGQLHSAPAGPSTLVRNGALAAVAAAVAVLGPRIALHTWLAERSAAELAAVAFGITTLVLAASTLHLWLEKRRVAAASQPAREPVPVGARAPDFTVRDLEHRLVSRESLLERGRPLALVFVGPGCGPCRELLPQLGLWQTTLANELTLALLSGGDEEQNRELASEAGLERLLLQKRWEVMNAYGVAATPTAIVVAADGTVASAPAAGSVMIEALIRTTLHNGAAPHAGQPVYAET